MSDVPKLVKDIAKDYRYSPAFIAVFIVAVMLLFFDKLTEPLKTFFVPSLVVYAMGASGSIVAMHYLSRRADCVAKVVFPWCSK
jgi:hypothetical protein